MNPVWFIARRYFFSKKNTHAVNIITGVSMLGVTVGTAAMLIVLSAFNGLENLIQTLYSNFDPDIKVAPKVGKHFEPDSALYEQLQAIDYVTAVSMVMEERALLRYRDRDFIATLKGVDKNFTKTANVESTLLRGSYFHNGQGAVIGAGVAYHLSIGDLNFPEPLQIFTAGSGAINLRRPDEAFRKTTVVPTGIFAVQPEYDLKYVLLPLDQVQSLLEQNHKISSFALCLAKGTSTKRAIREIEQIAGDHFEVLDRAGQQQLLFKVMKTEGLATYLILAFLLLIASFSLFGALTMLIIDKEQDIKTLRSLGATSPFIKRVFFGNGLLVTMVGCVSGLMLGAAIVGLQHYFGLVSLGQGYVVAHYPVQMRLSDLLKIGGTVFLIGGGLSFWSSSRIKL
jgi:lipoprotein-releasing system permease protein